MHLEALSRALFGGPVKAADLKVAPGTERMSQEKAAEALLQSMQRMGLLDESGFLKRMK